MPIGGVTVQQVGKINTQSLCKYINSRNITEYFLINTNAERFSWLHFLPEFIAHLLQ